MSLADLIYTAAFAKVLHVFVNAMRAESLLSYMVPTRDNRVYELIPICFADDLAVRILPGSCKMIVPKSIAITKLAIDVFSMFCLEINLRIGKSEAVPIMCGKGKRDANLHLQSVDFKVPIYPDKSNSPLLHFPQVYQHMGTKLAVKGMAPEVTKRIVCMTSGINQYSAVLNNPRISTKTKMTVVTVYLLTRGTFQCSTWPVLTQHQFKRFHGKTVGIYRKATNNCFDVSNPTGDMFSDADIVNEYKLLAPSTILRNARIQLLFRMFIKNPRAVIDMFFMCCGFLKGWMEAIESDLRFLNILIPGFYNGSIKVFGEYLFQLGNPELRTLARKVKRVFRTPFANILTDECRDVLQVRTLNFPCLHCTEVKDTFQKLKVHMYSKHRIKDDLWLHFRETYCTVCMLEFHKREKMYEHLKNGSPKCCLYYLNAGPCLSREEAQVIDENLKEHYRELYSKGLRRQYCEQLCYRICGPRIYVPGDDSHHHPLGVGRQHRNAPVFPSQFPPFSVSPSPSPPSVL